MLTYIKLKKRMGAKKPSIKYILHLYDLLN